MPSSPRRPPALRLLVPVFVASLGFAGLPGPAAPLGLPTARADDLPPGPDADERREAVEHHLERAWAALREGNHDEVLARMRRVERYQPDNADAPYLRALVADRVGDYQKGLELLDRDLEKHPDHRGARALRFDLLLDVGRYEDVERLASAVLEKTPDDAAAATARGLALEALGRRDDAVRAYDAAIQAHNASKSAPEDVPWVARAAIHMTWASPKPSDDLLQPALTLLERWIRAHPDDQDALLEEANLFQADRGANSQAKAASRYKRLLDKNPELAEARVGRARVDLVFYQQDDAIHELERALQTNPNLVPALSLFAAIHVGNGDYDKADEMLRRAEKVNPRDAYARAVRAARAWITGDESGYQALEKEALAADPKDGRFFVTLADLVGERQRRYDVAAKLAEKAIATDPDDALAYVTYGEDLMNLGRTDDARTAFRTAVDKSKRHEDVTRDNWLEVLSVIDGFDTEKTERFVIRQHPSEDEVMRHYLPPLLEEAWKTLSAKYGYVPTPPVRVDSFHIATDFSVRSVGVPGLPALGVCFGNVITLLGPTSEPVGAFSWAQTAWHEFAHVITLGESKGQVPRWLTEGLSVYEEAQHRASWGRGMEGQLFDRLKNHRLLKMSLINRAFRGPDIMFAYYQGALIVEHLVKTRSFDVIPKMLREFAQDRTTEQVFHDVLSIELDDYDAEFEKFIDAKVGGYRMVPHWDQESLDAFRARAKKDAKDLEARVDLGWAYLQRGNLIDAGASLGDAKALQPDDPSVVLLEGGLAEASGRMDLASKAYQRYLDLGQDDVRVRLFLAHQALGPGGDSAAAVRHLEAAKTCFPTLQGKVSPFLQLAKLYEGEGKVEAAIRELEGYAAIAGDDYEVRKKIKDYYQGKHDVAKVAELSAEMIDINPFGAGKEQTPDVELHREYADALDALGRPKEALREREVQVAVVSLLPEDERVQAGAVDDHIRLGRAYIAADRPLDALSQASAALRLSPDDAGARILKGEAEEAAGYR